MYSKADNTKYQVDTDADVEREVPQKFIPNDLFLTWVRARFPADRLSDRLNNDKPNKYAAYYWWGNTRLLHSKLIVHLARIFIGDTQPVKQVQDDHASFSGVALHENAKFLYQSRQAEHAVSWGYADWAVLFSFSAWAAGSHIALLPMLVSFAFVPRRWTQ